MHAALVTHNPILGQHLAQCYQRRFDWSSGLGINELICSVLLAFILCFYLVIIFLFIYSLIDWFIDSFIDLLKHCQPVPYHILIPKMSIELRFGDIYQISIWFPESHIDGLVQNCSNSIANALELLQTCTKPSIYIFEESRDIHRNQPIKLIHEINQHRFSKPHLWPFYHVYRDIPVNLVTLRPANWGRNNMEATLQMTFSNAFCNVIHMEIWPLFSQMALSNLFFNLFFYFTFAQKFSQMSF